MQLFAGGDGVFRFCQLEDHLDAPEVPEVPEVPEGGSSAEVTSESESSERDHEIPKKKRKINGELNLK